MEQLTSIRLADSPESFEPPRVRASIITTIVFVVGAASLGSEIGAARLLAPFFGASTFVWANTIATVLVALAAGYWLGGKLADRRPTLGALCALIAAAAVLLAVVPFVASPFLGAAAGALDSVSAGAFVGSLVSPARAMTRSSSTPTASPTFPST